MGGALGGLAGQFRALVPALSVAAVVQFGRAAFTAADHINDLAQRIGFAGSTLSALNIPLLQAGSNLDEFAASAAILNNQVGEAAKGNQEAVQAFDQLGLSVRNLMALSEEDRFYAVADALSRVGDQATRTEAGRNLLGRGFAAMNPILDQTNGNMRGFVEQAKAAGDALTDEQLQRIDEFGDTWVKQVERLKLAMANAMPGLQLYLDGLLGIVNLPTNAFKAGEEIGYALRGLPKNVSTTEPKHLNDAEAALIFAAAMAKGRGAAGSNAGLLKPKKDPVGDYLNDLRQQNDLLNTPQPDREAMKAEFDLRNAAAKEGVRVTQEQITLARELAAANYQAQNPNPVEEYTRRLEEERQVMLAGATDREGMRAYFELTNQLRKDGITLSDEEKQRVIDLTGANDKLRKSIEESERAAQQMHDELRDGLTDIILHFDSATDAAGRFFDEIASQILKKHVTGPLADAIAGESGGGGLLGLAGGALGSLFGGETLYQGFGPNAASTTVGGLGSLLGFADGGRPPVGVPSMVGERGPEIFVPDSAGTVVPNHAIGGSSVTVVQHNSFGSGVTRQEVASMLPALAAASKQAVFEEIQRGGRGAQIVGTRT